MAALVHPHSDTSFHRTKSRILYLTNDGLLEPLGASQVVSYVLRLSELGFSYEILSLEKPDDLGNSPRVQDLQKQLQAGNVRWDWVVYAKVFLPMLALTYVRFFLQARRRLKNAPFDLVHARSFIPAMMARLLHKMGGPRYVFDARGYWIDERAESGRWFKTKMLYTWAKSLEFKVARDAAAIVTLTNLQRDDFRGLFPEKPIETISTCVDFHRFRPGNVGQDVEPAIRNRLRDKLVLVLIGSINASYKTRESIHLFAAVKALYSQAHLLCLTRQREEMRALITEAAISEDSFTIRSVPHEQMHQWMTLAHWGLLLLEFTPAKRASIPTKLGEMLAAGVRPVQYGCNEEVALLVANAGSGIVLKSLADHELHTAARQIVEIGSGREGIAEARALSFDHFSLANGVRKYSEVLAHAGCLPCQNGSLRAFGG